MSFCGACGARESRSFGFAQDDGLSDRMSFAPALLWLMKRFSLTAFAVVAYSPRAGWGLCFCFLKRFCNTWCVCRKAVLNSVRTESADEQRGEGGRADAS